MRKTVLSILLLLAMLLGVSTLAACGNANPPEDTEMTEKETQPSAPDGTTAEITTAEQTTAEVTTAEPAEQKSVLDGKKVMFIGNSMIYYGGVVTKGDQRKPDTGLFYQICKKNGDNVTVYDCTYGNHSLDDFLTKGCGVSGCGTGSSDHLGGIDLSTIDYVIMSEAGENNSSIIGDIKNIMARFTNPDTVFVYLCHTYSYTQSHTNITGNLKNIYKRGVEIVDWGHVCFDVYKGTAKVPDSTMSYVKNTFVNYTSSDKHHPNPLAGYIAAQMTYCALTGKSAVGMDYSFRNQCKYGDGTVSYASYPTKYYTDGQTSNFAEVFKSEADMKGLQTLMDQYLNKFNLGVGKKIPVARRT